MRHLIIPIIFLAFSFSLSAQTLLPIPNDPSVITGHTGNGLTFYLVKDLSANRGFADFYMVQKWGTSIETPPETGFTALLSGMNLMESRGFPDGTLFPALANLGIPMDRSLVSRIGTDDVIMGLKGVPVTDPSVLDEVLSAIINMCSGAEVNEQTIDSGLAFHYHGTATRQCPRDRERKDLLKTLFPSDRSLYASTDEEIENIYEAGVQSVWGFQKAWCRPETQALVVVGDIDINAMKSKISLLSSTLSRGDHTTLSHFTPYLKTGEEVFHSYIDREADMAYLMADFLQKPVTQAERGTHIALVRHYISSILRNIMDSRINSLKENVRFPIYTSDVTLGDFCGISETDALSITLSTTPDHIYDLSEFLSSVLTGLKKGVSEEEFRNAADRYRLSLSQHTDFTAGIFRHFLKGFSFPSYEVESGYVSKLQNTFGIEQMNAYLSSFIENNTYRIIHCMSPYEVCDSELKSAFERGKLRELLPPDTDRFLSSRTQTASVKIKAPVSEPVTGSLSYTLPNYSKVYFKKTDCEPGRIALMAVSRGGLSLADKSFVFLSRYINEISGLSLPPIPDSKNISLRREFTPDRTYLKGSCRTEDLEQFFKLVSRCFTDCGIDESSFKKKFEEVTLKDVYGFASPEARFDQFSAGCMEPKKEYSPLDWRTVSAFLDKTCSNIGGYTFLIAGDCSENLIKEYIEKYLAPVQGKKMAQTVPVGLFNTESGKTDHTIKMPMETPRYLYGIRITNEFTYSLQGVLTASIISSLIRQKVAENLFEEGILVSSSEDFIRTPKNLLSLEFRLTSPDELSFYEKILDRTLEDLKENGVPDDRIEAARSYVAATHLKRAASETDYWIEAMEARINGKDFLSQRDATLSAIPCGEINNSLKMFLNSALRKKTRIDPDIFIVPELPPIEFEDPFPAPLDTIIDLSLLLGRPEQTGTAPDDDTPAEDVMMENQSEKTDTVSVSQAVISDTSDM